MHSTAEEREVGMTEDGSQPLMKPPAMAVHRKRVVFLATACAVGRGCNVVCQTAVDVWCTLGARNKKHQK